MDFESDENCKAVKKAMEDCEIDGCKVTVAYAKSKVENRPPATRGGLAARPAGRPADQRAVKGEFKKASLLLTFSEEGSKE